MTCAAPPIAKRFAPIAQAYYRRYAIGSRGMRLLLDRDWQGLVDAGVTVYLLTKLGAALGVSLLEMGAAMRGMSGEEFRHFIEEQNQRNLPLARAPRRHVAGEAVGARRDGEGRGGTGMLACPFDRACV